MFSMMTISRLRHPRREAKVPFGIVMVWELTGGYMIVIGHPGTHGQELDGPPMVSRGDEH